MKREIKNSIKRKMALLTGFFFGAAEIEKLKIYKETVIVPGVKEKWTPSCGHLGTGNYCQTCGKKREMVHISEKKAQIKKELVGYKGNFFRGKEANHKCGCYNCLECSFMQCPDCTICPCKECKREEHREIGYPDLANTNNYDKVFACDCIFEKSLCDCKARLISENHVPSYFLKYDLKLFFTGEDFGIFYQLSENKVSLDEDYLHFKKNVDQLCKETGLHGVFEIRQIEFK